MSCGVKDQLNIDYVEWSHTFTPISNYQRHPVAQSVKHLALDFSSSHDLTVREFEPRIRLWADGAEPAWDSLSLSLSAPLPAHSLSLSK